MFKCNTLKDNPHNKRQTDDYKHDTFIEILPTERSFDGLPNPRSNFSNHTRTFQSLYLENNRGKAEYLTIDISVKKSLTTKLRD